MPAGHPLGDYLRARRALLQPADVRLDAGPSHRRVDGLPRSEVAQIAGISTEYYVTLEQGQETRPTDQVVEYEGKGHSLTLDAGWTDVAEDVLAWLAAQGFAPAGAQGATTAG